MKKVMLGFLGFVFILSAPRTVFAVGSAGFENATFSAKSIGQGNAVIAEPDEPAAISYNPAGIADLPGFQFQGNLALINAFTDYNSAHATQSDAKSTGTINVVPTSYVTMNPGCLLGDRVAFGIGTDSPFGLSKKYRSNHEIARYTGVETSLKMYTIKPVAAVKLTDWWSVGAGPMYYRVYDFFGVQAYPNQIIVAGLPDGLIRLNLRGEGWGWHVGTLLKPHEKHQLAFYFRSPVHMHLGGLIKVEQSSFGGNFEVGGDLKMVFPWNMTVGYAFKPSDKTTIEADLGFTHWSSRRRSYINAASAPSAFDDMILNAIGKADKDWRDSFAIHLGGNHRFSEKFKAMAGFHFYTTPVPAAHYIPGVPDANRMGFSVGLEYKLSKNINLAASYLGIMSLRRRIDNTLGDSLGTPIDGTYKTYLQDAIFSMTYHWDDFFERMVSKRRVSASNLPAQ